MKAKSFQKITLKESDLIDLAYIIGALRDGCFTEKKDHYTYRIRIYQKNKEWIQLLAKKLERVFGKKPVIEVDKRKPLWSLKIDSKQIYRKLVILSEYPGNQKEWTTPRWIFKASLTAQKEYVKGFFDAEGGVPHVEENKINREDIKIHFSQGNKQTITEIRSLIQKFGIRTGSVCGPYYKEGYKDPQYVVMVHGIPEVTKFYQVFGSFHPNKIKRLNVIKDMVK